MSENLYKLLIFSSLLLSFILSLFLWNRDYLGIKKEYKENIPLYEVLVSSLGNVRYTLAAYLWIRTEFYIHYSGEVAINNLPEIVYYSRFITILDPNFVEAYDFGGYQLAFFLNKPQDGINFLREGIKNNPDYWKLYYTSGIIYSQKFKNYKEASNVFIKAESLLFNPVTKTKYSYYKVENFEIASMYRFISKCLYEQREYKKALEYYNKVLLYSNFKSKLYYEIIKQLYGR